MAGLFQGGLFQLGLFQEEAPAPVDGSPIGLLLALTRGTAPDPTGSPIGLLLSLTRTVVAPPPALVDGSPIGLLLALTRTAVAPPLTPEPTSGGGPTFGGGYARKRKTHAERHAERFAEILAEVEGLTNGPGAEEASAGATSVQSHASISRGGDAGGTPGEADGFVSDAFGQALLARLLALPAEEIRLPVEPFPHILSKGRAAAIEAARLHAVLIQDDDEAASALLMASLF